MSVHQSSAKAAATVTEVAAMCQLSRSRFYELVQAGVFPEPVQNRATKRRIYTRDLIEKCLEIRQTGVGIGGKLIVFNRKRASRPAPRRAQPPSLAVTPKESPLGRLVMGMKSLGMTDVTDAQVEKVVGDLFPEGITNQDLGDVIRKVFLTLKKQ